MRRLYLSTIIVGRNILAKEETHHAKDVLRLPPGTTVELFDGNGSCGRGRIEYDGEKAIVSIDKVEKVSPLTLDVACAAAFPKGERAEFMVQKLAELGVNAIHPLITERSTVTPGRGKLDRYRRIAAEACRQSGNNRIPTIHACVTIDEVIKARAAHRRFHASLQADKTLLEIISASTDIRATLYVVGPEGGWSATEERRLRELNFTPYSLGANTLRIETAAIVTLAILTQALPQDARKT